MTFWQWLKTQKHRSDPVGDLSRDAIADEHHKGNTRRWWVRHLTGHGACGNATSAFSRAWQEYGGKQWIDQRGRFQ